MPQRATDERSRWPESVFNLPGMRVHLRPESVFKIVRNTQWEHVCKWFLETDPVYLAQLKKVWLWNKWPGRWGPDAGIDLVAQAKDGTLWAIQAKAYAPENAVTKKDMDSFLSESARPEFDHRLLIATTRHVSAAAIRASKAAEKPVSTIATKEVLLRAHLIPLLGAKRLYAITSEDVQRLKRTLSTKAPKTINNVFTVLNTLLKAAVEWQILDRVPCTIRLLKVSKPSAAFHDFDTYEHLVESARVVGSNTALIVLLGGEAGLRCGEMIALGWADVDLAKRQLCVQRSSWSGHVPPPKGGRLRFIPLTVRLAAALREHRHLRSALVVCDEDGKALKRRKVLWWVRRAARRGQVKNAGVHVLRHTFCSHLAMRGAPARAIQELAGHANITTTQRYMHLSPAAIEGAIRLLDGPVGGEMGEARKGATGKLLR